MKLIGTIVAAFVIIMIGCSLIAVHGVNARGLLIVGAPVSGGGLTCSGQNTTFITRAIAADATFDSTHQTAIGNYICGLVVDGVITGDLSTTGCGSKLDLLYVEATQSSAVARLNLCGTANPLDLTNAGVINSDYYFTAESGYMIVDSSAAWITPGINLSTFGGHYVLDSAHISSWVISPTTSGINAVSGVYDGTNVSYIIPRNTDDTARFHINNTIPSVSVANTDASGFYVSNRTGVNSRVGFKNGSSIISDSKVSSALPNATLYMTSSWNNSGTPLGSGWFIGMESVGAGLSDADISAVFIRGCTYLTAVQGSKPSYCP